MFAQVAHEVLAIDPHKISVRFGDTAASPVGTGTYTSRSMVTTGGAIAEACRLLMKPIAKIGAHLLQCKADDVEIKDGRVHGPQGSVEFAEIGRAWYHHPEDLPADMDAGGLTATPGHKAHDPGVFSYSAHAAVVAVDPETGGVEVIDYAIVADCGTQVNPMLVEGQVVGGFSNGLGNALFEESGYDASGQPTATTLADYTAPNARLDAGGQARFHRDAVAVLDVRHQGHRRERRHRPAGGDRQCGQRCVAAARRRGVRDADLGGTRSRGDCARAPI